MRGQKASLITWEWMVYSARVTDRIAAILSSRRSDASVAEYVEFLYLIRTSTVAELASYARNSKRNSYLAKRTEIVNGAPQENRIHCVPHPWLYARIVSDLHVRVYAETGIETVSWKKPKTYKWNADQTDSEVPHEGRAMSTQLLVAGPLTADEAWDRQNAAFRAGSESAI